MKLALLYFIQYPINVFIFTGDETMAEVQHQFWEVKMNCKTRNSSKKPLHILNLLIRAETQMETIEEAVIGTLGAKQRAYCIRGDYLKHCGFLCSL